MSTPNDLERAQDRRDFINGRVRNQYENVQAAEAEHGLNSREFITEIKEYWVLLKELEEADKLVADVQERIKW